MSKVLPQCVWDVGAELGEGPIWHAPDRAVLFVDIKGKQLHRLFVDSGRRESGSTPQEAGFILPVEGGGFVCGMADGLYLTEGPMQDFNKWVAVDAHIVGNRLNDGFVDAQGRLWFGTMSNSETDPSGTLYRVGAHAALLAQDSGYVITNGPAMSPDGRTLYHTDTLKRRVYSFMVSDDGSLTDKRLFLTLQGSGYPDGMAVDVEGCVWVAMFGGWRIDRYSPSGELLESIPFPCANVTKMTFGGDDLHTVYATTAWKGLHPADRARQPLAGGLFSFRLPTPGLPQQAINKRTLG